MKSDQPPASTALPTGRCAAPALEVNITGVAARGDFSSALAFVLYRAWEIAHVRFYTTWAEADGMGVASMVLWCADWSVSIATTGLALAWYPASRNRAPERSWVRSRPHRACHPRLEWPRHDPCGCPVTEEATKPRGVLFLNRVVHIH
jgi:hypothetical protein